ncbi:hypothetical protein HK102_013176 [Quaeritorhiza haematococci]|nr:hypothetical protein HK102_013176 [Quaeritorhiza haematococci]
MSFGFGGFGGTAPTSSSSSSLGGVVPGFGQALSTASAAQTSLSIGSSTSGSTGGASNIIPTTTAPTFSGFGSPPTLPKPTPANVPQYQNMSDFQRSILKLLDEKIDTDRTVTAESKDARVEVPAHKAVLRCRCPVFNDLLGTLDPEQILALLEKITPSALPIVLRYIYSDTIVIVNDLRLWLDLCVAADFLELDALYVDLQDQMCNRIDKKQWSVLDVCAVLDTYQQVLPAIWDPGLAKRICKAYLSGTTWDPETVVKLVPRPSHFLFILGALDGLQAFRLLQCFLKLYPKVSEEKREARLSKIKFEGLHMWNLLEEVTHSTFVPAARIIDVYKGRFRFQDKHHSRKFRD